MGDEGYYPPGAAYDPEAPYNQEVPEKKEFEVFISHTITKDTKVTTDDYVREIDYDYDGDSCGYVENINTVDTDWEEAYRQEHYTPLELIDELKKLLYEKLDNAMNNEEVKRIENLIQECNGWTTEEIVIEQI